MAAFFFVLHRGGWHGEELAHNNPLYLQATTACLSAIIVTQVVNVFLCRSSSNSVFKLSPFSNRLIVAGVIVESALILLIDYTPAGNAIFGTTRIPLAAWLFMFPLALAMLAFEELRKSITRGVQGRRRLHLGAMNRASI